MIAENNEIYLCNNLGSFRQCIKLKKQVNPIEFITKDVPAFANNSGKLELGSGECCSIFKLEAHGTRIKSIESLTYIQDYEENGYSGDSGPSRQQPKNITNIRRSARSSVTCTPLRRPSPYESTFWAVIKRIHLGQSSEILPGSIISSVCSMHIVGSVVILCFAECYGSAEKSGTSNWWDFH
jgi:hypothetical protein